MNKLVEALDHEYAAARATLRAAEDALAQAESVCEIARSNTIESIKRNLIGNPDIAKVPMFCRHHRYSGIIEKVYFVYEEAAEDNRRSKGYNESPYFTTQEVKDCSTNADLLESVAWHIFKTSK